MTSGTARLCRTTHAVNLVAMELKESRRSLHPNGQGRGQEVMKSYNWPEQPTNVRR